MKPKDTPWGNPSGVSECWGVGVLGHWAMWANFAAHHPITLSTVALAKADPSQRAADPQSAIRNFHFVPLPALAPRQGETQSSRRIVNANKPLSHAKPRSSKFWRRIGLTIACETHSVASLSGDTTELNMKTDTFKDIKNISYEGPKSKNPLAFKYYNAGELVEGKSMRDHLRFSVVYWHTFRGTGTDPFGMGTMLRPWDDGSNSVENAQKRARVAIEFIEKLGAPYYCFHDRDVAPEGRRLAETNKNLDAVARS